MQGPNLNLSGLNGTPRAVIEEFGTGHSPTTLDTPGYCCQCGSRQVILGTFPPLFAATRFTVCWLHRIDKWQNTQSMFAVDSVLVARRLRETDATDQVAETG